MLLNENRKNESRKNGNRRKRKTGKTKKTKEVRTIGEDKTRDRKDQGQREIWDRELCLQQVMQEK